MKIEIYSVDRIELLAYKPCKSRIALISIVDSDNSLPDLKNQPNYLLQLIFGDTCIESERAISDEQALHIAEFVFKHKDEIDLLICQCTFGKSRSAGCAAAITEFFYENGIDIFSNMDYSPNKLVYHKVINALQQHTDK